MNYLDYFISKYKSPSSPITYIEGTNLPSTGDEKKDANLKAAYERSNNEGLSTENTPEQIAIDLVVTDGLLKGVGLLGKGLWKGATFVAPRTTGVITKGLDKLSSGIGWVGNAVFSKPLQKIKAYHNPYSTAKPNITLEELFTKEADLTNSEMAKTARKRLIDYYNSSEYKNRLLKAGFSEEQANARISKLIENTNKATIQTGVVDNGASAVTNVTPWDLNDITIVVDPSKMTKSGMLDDAILEELAHAGELSGLTEKSAKQWMEAQAGSAERFKLIHPEQYEKVLQELQSDSYKALGNSRAVPYNISLGGDVDLNNIVKQIYVDLSPEEQKVFLQKWNALTPEEKVRTAYSAAEYFTLPHEQRARALARVIDQMGQTGYYPQVYRMSDATSGLGKEFQKFYRNTGNYLDHFISIGAPIIAGGTVYESSK